MGTLSFEPLLPPALWLALALAGAVLIVWYGLRRPGAVQRRRWGAICGLTGLGLALVLVILLNPTWIEPIAPPAGKPLLTILVDASASMAAPDAAEGQTRFRAAGILAQGASTLDDKYEVRVVRFDESSSASSAAELAPLVPSGPVTDLAGALAAAVDPDRPQGQALLLLSDGIHNAGGGADRVLEAARLAKALACPIYARTLGGDAEVKDLAVGFRSPQELAFVGQKVPVTVVLQPRGLRGARASLVLTCDGKEVERQQAAIADDEAVELRFQVSREQTGLHRCEVRAEAVPGEVTTINNTGTMLLRVVDRPVRVLLLEGKPYWDAKFLMRTLLLDLSIELDSIVRVSDNRFLRRTLARTGEVPAAPMGEGPATAPLREDWQVLERFSDFDAPPERLRSYQILVLGRDADAFLNDAVLSQIRTWIAREGGCLVCFRGQPTTQVNERLSQLLPVRWAPAQEMRFHVRPTDRGRDLRWLPAADAGRLPTLSTVHQPEKPRPLAVILATGQLHSAEAGSPVVTYQPYGTGRVVVLEGAGMWRWAFLPPQQKEHDGVYRLLWHSLLRWLVSSVDLLPGQKLALRSDKISFSTSESATATLLLAENAGLPAPPTIELLLDGSSAPQRVKPVPLADEPGTFRINFGKLPEGRYQARVAGPAGDDPAARVGFDVRGFLEEQLDLKSRSDLMARIAQESGGAVLTGDGSDEVLRDFQERLAQARPVRVRRLSAWDRWWVLLLVLGVWGVAWGIRRHSGLV